jgi:KipI family sensor histidine kinase inhibitor
MDSSRVESAAYGPDAFILRFAERADETAFRRARQLVAELERCPLPGQAEVVPAFTTLLIRFASGTVSAASGSALAAFCGRIRDNALSSVPEDGRLVEIPARYDGPDLARVARSAGLSVEDAVARHLAPDYRVHCLGFAPGFPYLGGLDPSLATPRLATPRTSVRAGSIAIGGEHTGIYSTPSPGGWNLVGRTDATLFEPLADSLAEMFLLRAGDLVRFIQGPDGAALAPDLRRDDRPESAASTAVSRPVLRVLASGAGLAVQDLGRPGFARFGVPPGGAMDPHAAAWANRLLDNPPSAPVLELCLQGQRLEVLEDGWFAVAGSAGGVMGGSAYRRRAGEVLEFPPGPSGVWSYLALPGGFGGSTVLGSVATDARAGIGRPFVVGDRIPAATRTAAVPGSAVASRWMARDERRDHAHPPALRVWPGPQWTSFSSADRERFFATGWRVSTRCDRVGYRLDGPALAPPSAEAVSEPVIVGTVQVPADGRPIVTMPDGPTLGGYAKLGVVDRDDLARLAQCRGGQEVRFVPAR